MMSRKWVVILTLAVLLAGVAGTMSTTSCYPPDGTPCIGQY